MLISLLLSSVFICLLKQLQLNFQQNMMVLDSFLNKKYSHQNSLLIFVSNKNDKIPLCKKIHIQVTSFYCNI